MFVSHISMNFKNIFDGIRFVFPDPIPNIIFFSSFLILNFIAVSEILFLSTSILGSLLTFHQLYL